MSAPVIQVEDLSKRYRIGMAVDPHRSFRDAVVDAVAAPLRRLRALREGSPDSPDTFWALRDIRFDVTAGEVVGIIGRNGAGKSTLLKILSRITRPTTGRAVIAGHVGSLLEVGTGFHPDLTGRENLYLNGAILGMTKAAIERKFDEIVAFADIGEFLDTPVKRYSSGMRVRLGFAVAAHLEPEILIVDEVLAVGDVAFQRKCLGKMSDVADGGRTVLFVSHNLAAVQNLCTRVIHLADGRMVDDGEPDEVIRGYLTVAAEAARTCLNERTDRQGNGQIRFSGVTVLDGDGNPAASVRSGDPVQLHCELANTAGRDLRDITVAVGVESQLGTRVMFFSNELAGKPFEVLGAEGGAVRIRLERLPLIEGRYMLTLFCSANGKMTDWIRYAGEMLVEAGDFFGAGKLPQASQCEVLVDHEMTLV